MYNTYNILGADLYCDGTQYSPHTGSSMATAVISAAASILWDSGYPIQAIKAILLSACEQVVIETKPSIPIGRTDIEDYIYAELHRQTEVVSVFDESQFRDKVVRAIA